MNDLTLEQFDDFFQALNNASEPFHWQRDLVKRVARKGWPGTMDLPTASGKTAVLDIAVFHMALDAEHQPAERRAPRRCFFVVDRRVIVDEAYERALGIARKLREATDGVLRVVADRLCHLAGGELPLATAILRGGIYREDAWVRSPVQPLLVVSTVDQVGSRLLFRGYGVSDYAKPIHAGVVGNDALFILDEVHLSRPFQQTLEVLLRYRRWREHNDIPDRFVVVAMSATPGAEADFKLPLADHSEKKAPELARRLRGHKLARLQPVTVDEGEDGRERLAAACVEEARRLSLENPTVRVIGIVVNRVHTARRILEMLQNEEGDVVLLTGRARPVDRDDLIEKYRDRMIAGRARREDDRLLFVVATQCIESGANFYFDALITECASLDALRQRFGRLDRLGHLQTSHAVILARSDQVAPKSDADPVYGAALRKTWGRLQKLVKENKQRKQTKGKRLPDEVDFGVEWFQLPQGEELTSLLAPAREAPVLLPAHLDTWVQTYPVPTPDPEIALWLHSAEAGPPDVHVVWRADLEEEDLERLDRARDIVAACPPSSAELMLVPLHVVRAWLLGLKEIPDLTDVEGTFEKDERRDDREGKPALRWWGEESELIYARDLHPGDTVVVPATYGGADKYGWSPTSKTPVSDLGDRVHLQQRGRPIFRVHPSVLQSWLPPAPNDMVHPLVTRALAVDAEDPNLRDAIRGWLEQLRNATDVSKWAQAAATEMLGNGFRVFGPPAVPTLVLISKTRVQQREQTIVDFTTDDDTSCLTSQVTIEKHSAGVRDLARNYAERCGLPPSVCDDLALAGWLHDIGKADPRFQLWLYNGDRVALEGSGELLAKSGMLPGDRAAIRRARERSGYPEGARHEVQSVPLLEACSALREQAHDWDLVLHLVASHHGRCRPFSPVVPDPSPVQVRLRHGDHDFTSRSDHGLERINSGVADRFWRLIERYGWYGLPYLEAILRLADWRRSEMEMP